MRPLPSDPNAPAELDLGDLVMRVARSLRRAGMTAYEPYDLAPHQARALRVVAGFGAVRLGELAHHLRIAPRSATDVVDALETRGLLMRSPDPNDRRAQVVALTPDGERLVERVAAARKVGADAYFERLSPRDQASLRRILERLDADS